MIVKVTEEFRVAYPMDEETGRCRPDCTLPVGLTGTFIKEGVAKDLLGVEDGERIYTMSREEPFGINILYVPTTKARLIGG